MIEKRRRNKAFFLCLSKQSKAISVLGYGSVVELGGC